MTGDENWAAIRADLFPAAHASITDWETFPKHRDSRGAIHSHKPHSSQALAIDVFGTLGAVHEEHRTRVCDVLAAAAGLSPGGPWQVELEWCDPANHLAAKRATQVDALLVGAHAIIVAECKFTEPGGGCSQTKRTPKGRGAGLPQCNGRYVPQVNPGNGVAASCALTGKGIRYWEVIPRGCGLSPRCLQPRPSNRPRYVAERGTGRYCRPPRA